MKIADGWKDYRVLATSNGYKKEKWNNIILLRPDPQVIWENKLDESDVFAKYTRSSDGGGKWTYFKKVPAEWTVSYKDLKFLIKPMGFKHTGLFPEQAVNWDIMTDLIKKAGRPISVLNLFGYTGGATVALAKNGATVCHVDAAKNMVERCKQNAELSGVPNDRIRYIVDDCKKFVMREIKRGKRYDAIIMDPPSYGRGPNGEMWKLESELFPLVNLCKQVLSSTPLFFLINSYTTGLQPQVIKNILQLSLKGGSVEAYEVGLPTDEGIVLPCGCTGLWSVSNP